jgi:hypothetical protein
MPQVEVCFLRLPHGFPAVPPYFNHTSVAPAPYKTSSSLLATQFEDSIIILRICPFSLITRE